MNRIKEKSFLEKMYFVLSALFTGVFIFEIPGAVFYSPLLLFAAFLVYSIYSGRTINYSVSMLVLLIFTVSYVYFIYKPEDSLYYQSYIHIQAVFMYIIGFNFLNDKSTEERKKYAENYFLIISLFFIAYILITFYHHFYQTAADLSYRFYYSVWYSSVTKPSTVISMCLVFPLAYGLYSLFYLRWPYKIVGGVFCFITVYINVRTATRTLIFLFPFALTAEFIFWLIFEKKKKKIGFILLGICAAALIGIIVLFVLWKDSLAQTFAQYGFSRIFSPGRSTQLRIKYIMNVINDFKLNYFGGGIHSLTCGTPHNIWLYIYDWGGIVSFGIFCVFTGFMIYNYIRFFFNHNYSVALKAFLSTALALIFVEFMMEPFILPLPSFYILCYFVFGLISGFSRKSANAATAKISGEEQ